MQEPVEDRGGDDGVPQDVPPLGEALVFPEYFIGPFQEDRTWCSDRSDYLEATANSLVQTCRAARSLSEKIGLRTD